MKYIVKYLLFFIFLVSFVAQAKPCDTPCYITVVDAKGREVQIKTPIERYVLGTIDLIDYVVPLMGREALDKLVANGYSGSQNAYIETYYDSGLYRGKKPALISEYGYPFDPEALVSYRPDVVIINAEQGYEVAMQSEAMLNMVGIPMVFVDIPGEQRQVDNSAQYTFKLMGEIFGRQKEAQEVIRFIDQQFSAIKHQLPEDLSLRPSVYYEFFGNKENIGTTQSSQKSWGAIIHYAGGDNIADSVLRGKNAGSEMVLNPELLLRFNPDFIITSGTNDMGLTSGPDLYKTADFTILDRPGWSRLSAVNERHIYEIMFGLNRSPFSFYAVQRLAKTFYPERFSTLDPEQNLKEYFSRFTLLKEDHSLWFMRVEK